MGTANVCCPCCNGRHPREPATWSLIGTNRSTAAIHVKLKIQQNSSAGAKSTLQSKSPTKLQSQSAEQQPTNYFYRFGCSHKTQQKLQLQTQTQPFHNQMCVFSRPHCGINAQHSPAHTAPISSPTTAQQSQSWSKSQSGSVSGLWTCGRRKCATCCTISNWIKWLNAWMTDASNWQAANERLRQRTQIEWSEPLRVNVGQ